MHHHRGSYHVCGLQGKLPSSYIHAHSPLIMPYLPVYPVQGQIYQQGLQPEVG